MQTHNVTWQQLSHGTIRYYSSTQNTIYHDFNVHMSDTLVSKSFFMTVKMKGEEDMAVWVEREGDGLEFRGKEVVHFVCSEAER